MHKVPEKSETEGERERESGEKEEKFGQSRIIFI